jgi:gamma-glutamyltranspeptidase/glutathione hydrolase
MHGVIAGGSKATAEAGAEVLRRGGNAADAAAAACFATAVGEPTLTSLAGSGMMIYRDAATEEVTICDCFSDAPLLKPSDVEDLDFYPKDLDFGPTTQRFYIGAGAGSVPGIIPGLCTVLERWGTMDLADVVAPACKLAREGAMLGDYQGRAARLLEPILTHTESGRSVFHIDGRMIRAGDRFKIPQLADTLEALAADDWRKTYEEVMVKPMLAQFSPEQGGLITRVDFDRFEIRFREPLALTYRDAAVLTPSAPATGGTMIALMLQLLDTVDVASLDFHSADHIRRLAHAMAVADAARAEGAAALSGERFEHWRGRFEAFSAEPHLSVCTADGGGPNHTTHVSVIDAEGNAAAMTFSYGEGNAHIIANTGIMMNNLMGEEDLFPDGFGSAPPGERLPTMMSPTLMLDDDGNITVMGTGGANRIRTAIVQVLSLLADRGMAPTPAVAAPRVHFEGGVLNAEVYEMEDRGLWLEDLGPNKLVRFPEMNLFFGGVHMVQRLADGTLRGTGDPRRGGVCIVV